MLNKLKSNFLEILFIICFVVSVCYCMVGCKDKDYSHDNPVEEMLEGLTEDILEGVLDIPDDGLEDKIDFTPWSDENAEA